MGGLGMTRTRCSVSRGKGHARHGKQHCLTDTRSVALAMWCWALGEQGTGRSKSTFDCCGKGRWVGRMTAGVNERPTSTRTLQRSDLKASLSTTSWWPWRWGEGSSKRVLVMEMDLKVPLEAPSSRLGKAQLTTPSRPAVATHASPRFLCVLCVLRTVMACCQACVLRGFGASTISSKHHHKQQRCLVWPTRPQIGCCKQPPEA